MRRTFKMYSRHAFSMCPARSLGQHFKCLYNVPGGNIFAVSINHILNVFSDLSTTTFQAYLKCDHNVPSGFSAGKLRQNFNIQHAHVEVRFEVDVDVGLRVGLELSRAVGVGSALGCGCVGLSKSSVLVVP